MRKLIFADGGLYHIYNRGVDKREIFESDVDRLRFLYSMFLSNNTSRSFNFGRNFKEAIHLIEAKPHSIVPIVEILAFVLMPNHFHFIVRQSTENGISRFMQKLGTAYTCYFNKKYGRGGALFQAPFKVVEVTTNEQLYHLFFYLHVANPLALSRNLEPVGFVHAYRWSSLPDYLGRSNFSLLTERSVFHGLIGDRDKIDAELRAWLRERDRYLPLIEDIVFDTAKS